MLFCCDPTPPLVRPSTLGNYYLRALRVIMILQLLQSVLYLIAQDVSSAVYEIILAFLLFQATTTLHYCYLIIYHLLILMNMISLICLEGNRIQHGTMFSSKVCPTDECSIGYITYIIFIQMTSMLLYIFCLVFSFKSYKEFKSLYQEQVAEQNANNQGDIREPLNRRVPFEGRGVAIG